VEESQLLVSKINFEYGNTMRHTFYNGGATAYRPYASVAKFSCLLPRGRARQFFFFNPVEEMVARWSHYEKELIIDNSFLSSVTFEVMDAGDGKGEVVVSSCSIDGQHIGLYAAHFRSGCYANLPDWTGRLPNYLPAYHYKSGALASIICVDSRGFGKYGGDLTMRTTVAMVRPVELVQLQGNLADSLRHSELALSGLNVGPYNAGVFGSLLGSWGSV